jgi:cupin fold WbuC family metalloprotein
MLTALQQGTYVRPHRHPDDSGVELLLVVQGRLGVIEIDESAAILDVERAGEASDHLGVEIPAGALHTVVALAPDTVVLEVKEGAYPAGGDKEISPSFPEEGTPEANELLARWRSLFCADPD